ncbi:MAG: CPBP family intramembrane metalloprotease [Myxococcales bacterium]|jgi:membrane protease YdiL (CAAX protease family)|nr:CPBP family intramembrane metalloprotease [Myxococcales bacterium]HQY62940.1 CPBP family intramembrane metalloprotease [Polyangiaceae bacterium]
MVQPALLALVALVIGLASFFGLQPARAGQPSFFLLLGAPNLALALFGLWRARRDGVLGSWFSVRGGDFSIGFVTAGATFGAAWAFTKAFIPPGSPREAWLARIYLQLGDPAVIRAHVAVSVLGLVAIAACEEIVWRGLVVALLEERVGSRRAWLYSAVLYAVAHVPAAFALRDPAAGPNPLLPIAALGCGLVWSFLGRRLGRLTPGIFAHGLFLWALVVMFRLWGPSI